METREETSLVLGRANKRSFMQEEMELEIDVMEYVNVARRWLWLIVSGTFLAAGVALVVSFILPPVYEAEADVASAKSLSQISLSPDYKTLSEAQLTQGLDMNARQKALVAIAKGNAVASAVVVQLGSSLSTEERQIANLVEMVNVSTDGDLIRIRVQNKDPQKAATIANTWAQVYSKRVNELYTETPTSVDQVQGQADQAWQAYQAAEAALSQFIGVNQADELLRQITAKQNTINDLYAAQRNLDRLLQDARSLQNLLNKDPSSTPSDAGNRLAALLIRANAATLSYSVPQPLQLQVTSAALNDPGQPNVRSEIDSLITILETQKKQVEARLADSSLQQQVLVLQKQLEQENAKKLELTSARDLAWSTYKTMAGKMGEVRIAQLSTGTIVRLASSAVAPERPIAPKKSQNALLAAVVGLILSLGMAFFIEFKNPKIRSSRDITKHLGLATFQVQTEGDKSISVPAGTENGISRTPQDYYRVWANLSVDSKLGGTLVVVSSDQISAAGLFVADLGVVAAQSGRSVILVDANVSSPALDKVFALPNNCGWSNLLEDSNADITGYMQTTWLKNLKVITSGPTLVNIDDLIVSPRLPSVIGKLKPKADLVIFTGPTISVSVGSMMIAKYVEGVLLFTVAGLTDREAGLQLKEELGNANKNLLGVILVHIARSSSLFQNLKRQISLTVH